MTGNSERQLESESKGIIQESFRFSQAEQLYGNMSFFTDTVLFEYSYPEKRLYLSANAKGQINLQAFERFFIKHRDNAPNEGEMRSFEFSMSKKGEPFHWCCCNLTAIWEDKKTAPLKMIGKLQDISGSKAREEQLLLKSLKDGLTGVYNKSAFEYRVDELLKGDSESWLCMIDIDNFKEINDSYGHPTGDRILMKVGGMLCDLFPEPDLVGRVGGDEFVVFTSEPDVYKRAEKLLKRAKKSVPEGEGRLSVSIGIVSSTGKKEENYQRLFSQADRAMYYAKQAGKNRIASYHDNIWQVK
ncbi:GGDEF domain-containing protein [Lacrimispora sp. AGF001]|uniref:GGDEF domain-containing protein n=1 Tax=Lacrimispora sp. AGF001 TaxID=3401631 RepID=UPI003B439CB6